MSCCLKADMLKLRASASTKGLGRGSRVLGFRRITSLGILLESSPGTLNQYPARRFGVDRRRKDVVFLRVVEASKTCALCKTRSPLLE